MDHLRKILLDKYWLPEGTAFYTACERVITNGNSEKEYAVTIHNLASRLRPLSDAECLSPKEVLELIVPFHAYELKEKLGLQVRKEQRSPNQQGWYYQLEFTSVRIEGILTQDKRKLRVAVMVPENYKQYTLARLATNAYFGEFLQLPLASPEQIERLSTRTPAES